MDFLPMKGVEYLMVIGYLLLLVPFWLLLVGHEKSSTVPRRVLSAAGLRSWFSVPDWLSFHPGHAWAQSVGNNRVRIGMDDFAHRLIGRVDALHLPGRGEELVAGEKGWGVEADGHEVPILSPVSGRVVAVNEAALRSAGELGDDPYGTGWLMEVEVPSLRSTLRNLLSGRLARLWIEDAADNLSRRMSPELGTVLADGGVPVAGLARALEPDNWWDLAEELLLVKER